MKKTIFLVLTALSLLLAACGATATETPQAATPPDNTVVAEGHVIPLKDVKLAFAARGTVAEILVEEGVAVKKGDVLIRLADREQAEAALTAANLELPQAQQAFDTLMRNGPLSRADAWQAYMDAQEVRAEAEREWEDLDKDQIDDEIEDAEAEVKDKKEILDDAQEEADKYKDLKEDNPTRKDAEDELEQAQEEYNEAVRKLEELNRERDDLRARLDSALGAESDAKYKFELTKDGPDAEQLAFLEARLANAKAQVAAAENSLSNFDLKAPFNGVVTDVYVTVGQLLGPETWAVQMADFGEWMIETSDLTELEVVNISEGQQVQIQPDAIDGLTLSGTVESISQSSKTQGGDVIYTVKIRLDDSDPALRWGMTVEVTFLAGQ
jgi:multidrug resistance efflux pump